MRIISGRHRGRIIRPPHNLRARPTTDFAKESLFSVLSGRYAWEECEVLDLFAGTGSISYEFASRGVPSVTAVELNAVHEAFIRRTAAELGFGQLQTVKANVFLYLRRTARRFDVIFSDAPYDLPGSEAVIDLVFGRELLRPGGVLVFEHGAAQRFGSHPHFIEERRYGSVHFTLFGAEPSARVPATTAVPSDADETSVHAPTKLR